MRPPSCVEGIKEQREDENTFMIREKPTKLQKQRNLDYAKSKVILLDSYKHPHRSPPKFPKNTKFLCLEQPKEPQFWTNQSPKTEVSFAGQATRGEALSTRISHFACKETAQFQSVPGFPTSSFLLVELH